MKLLKRWMMFVMGVFCGLSVLGHLYLQPQAVVVASLQRDAAFEVSSFQLNNATNASVVHTAILARTTVSHNSTKTSTVLPDSKKTIKKVLSLVYFKGGSTFLGRLFAANPEAFYWFEIVQPMYLAMMGLMTIPYSELYTARGNRRNQTAAELDFIYEHLEKFYSCRLDELPIEMVYQDSVPLSGPEWNPYMTCMKRETHQKVWQTLTNACLKKHVPFSCRGNAGTAVLSDCLNAKFMVEGRTPPKEEHLVSRNMLNRMKDYWHCLHDSPLSSAFGQCIELASQECATRNLRAVKVMRMRLADTEKLVEEDPGFKVIHQLRDPRGALVSARSIRMLSRGRIRDEAKVVCHKMSEDIQAYKRLKEKYPDNYLQTKYEDLADAPHATLRRIYDFLGENVPEELEKHLHEITNSKYEPREPGALDTHRKNSTETAHKWRLKISASDKALLDDVCLKTIQDGGYKI